jgi:hypothetical protein
VPSGGGQERGRLRPCFGPVDQLLHDPTWKNNLLFNEYFHGENGSGLGMSHQTGWTGLVADVIRRHDAVKSVDETVRGLTEDPQRVAVGAGAHR